MAFALATPAYAAEPSLATPAALHLTRAQVMAEDTIGFSPPPYLADARTLSGPWLDVDLPHAPRLRHSAGPLPKPGEALTRITWYKVSTDGLASLPHPHYLYIPRWKTDGSIAVYGDGRLIYQSHGNEQWNGSNRPLWIALDDTAGIAPPAEIMVRFQHLRGIGGSLSSLWAGSHDALHWRYLVRDWFQAQFPFMSSAAFLALGVFAFFVWLRRRREKLYVVFSIMSVAAYIRTIHTYAGLERLPVSDEWFGWLTVNSAFWLLAVTHLFVVELHGKVQAWLTRTIFLAAAFASALSLPLLPGLPDATIIAPLIYPVLLVLSVLTFGVGLWNSWSSRSHGAILATAWSLFSISLFGFHDWLLQNNFIDIEGAFLAGYANVGAFFIFAYIMYGRYMNAIQDVEDANENLALRLREREAELTESHRQLREIEQRELLGKERERLMQDMHDGLGSSLVSALRLVEKGALGEAEIAEVLKGCIDDLRLTLDSMEQAEGDLLLLLATLRFRLAPRMESTGIRLHWEVAEIPPLQWLDPRSSLHILRIIQEAFTNIIKHTQATEISLTTAQEHDTVVVTIADNGKGFDFDQALQGRSHGLRNQKRRADIIGADISWLSTPSGTCLRLCLPLVRAPGR